MLRLITLSAVLFAGFVLAPHALAKQEPAPIPFALNGCIDFSQDSCGDADADGYLNWFEQSVGSDPINPDSSPELDLYDEQSRSNTCGDRIDNDLDGRTDNGDDGCRLDCRDFGPNQRCKDSDKDGWLAYAEDRYGSDPDNRLSTPESLSVPGTCEDGTDNDLDGDVDAEDQGCGVISDCIDFDVNNPCSPF